MTVPRPVAYAALALLLLALVGLSLIVGRAFVPWSAWWSADPRWAIIVELRLPRTLLGVAIGAGLGLAGAALQGYTRNPLADPGVLGVSSMAALGAVLALYYAAAAGWALPAAAMAGAAAGVGLLLLLAGRGSTLVTFILAGAVLNIVASAGVALALSLAPSPWAVGEIVDWLMGSLQDRSAAEVRLALPLIAGGGALLLTTARGLDALTLGDSGAASLGIALGRLRVVIAVGVGLVTGASVAVAGVIGFVGLVTPHLLRPWFGPRPGALLLPSALGGAVVVLAADILVRLLPAAGEVKLGVAMAAIGGPFFLVLLLTMRRRLA